MRKGVLLGLIAGISCSLPAADVFAMTVAGPDVLRYSEVSTVVSDNHDGTFTYNYTVRNTSPAPQATGAFTDIWPLIVDYEVPLNSPSAVSNIISPSGWSYEFMSAADYQNTYGAASPFGAPYILHWYTRWLGNGSAADYVGDMPIVPIGYNSTYGSSYYENFINGFLLTSNLGPTDGPYLSSWDDQFRRIGDPPLPGDDGHGGHSVGGGGALPFDAVPEPSTMVLIGIGAAGLLLLRRKASAE